MSISILSDDKLRIALKTSDDAGLPVQHRVTKWAGIAGATKEEVPDNLRKILTFGVIRKGCRASSTTKRDGHDLACILACLDIGSEECAVWELCPGKDSIGGCTTRLRGVQVSTFVTL